MENKLEIMINESGLEKSKAQVILDKFSHYFKMAADWEIKAKTLKVIDENQKTEMKIARTGRLFLREQRLSVEKTRKELKEQALREGKAIDGIANVLKALIVPIEQYLDKQEHFIEIRQKEKEELERIEIQKQIEAKEKEEERLNKLHQERLKQILPYKQWWEKELETEHLGKLTNFDNILNSLKQEKVDYDNEQEKIRLDNERLRKEAEEKEKQLKKEREEAERKAKEEKLKAEAEKKAIEEKARKEAEEKRIIAEKKANEEKKLLQEKINKIEAILKNGFICDKCGNKITF